MVVGSNLVKNELNFLFAKFSFGKNMKGQRNPSYKKGNLERLGRQPIMVFEWPLTPNSKPFSFSLALTSFKA